MWFVRDYTLSKDAILINRVREIGYSHLCFRCYRVSNNSVAMVALSLNEKRNLVINKSFGAILYNDDEYLDLANVDYIENIPNNSMRPQYILGEAGTYGILGTKWHLYFEQFVKQNINIIHKFHGDSNAVGEHRSYQAQHFYKKGYTPKTKAISLIF